MLWDLKKVLKNKILSFDIQTSMTYFLNPEPAPGLIGPNKLERVRGHYGILISCKLHQNLFRGFGGGSL